MFALQVGTFKAPLLSVSINDEAFAVYQNLPLSGDGTTLVPRSKHKLSCRSRLTVLALMHSGPCTTLAMTISASGQMRREQRERSGAMSIESSWLEYRSTKILWLELFPRSMEQSIREASHFSWDYRGEEQGHSVWKAIAKEHQNSKSRILNSHLTSPSL
jgi:hypothetical protein